MGDSIFTTEQLAQMQEQLDMVRRELQTANPMLMREMEGRRQREGASEALNGSYMRIEEDAMAAWLYLYPPQEGREYTVEEVKEYIASQGVAFGLHESNIHAMIAKKIYDREVKVAVGRVAGQGKDGYYEYLFTPTAHRVPTIREDGTVDYTSMSMLQNVSKNEKIAVYHPALAGEPGYNVLGMETKVRPARELPPIRGKNIARLDDEVTYVSMIDGKVELRDGRVDVQRTHEIVGDVTLITGKVEFYGDVVVKGSVEAGVTIRAGRNIVVTGTVEGVNMYAGGDIVLQRGVNGGTRAQISARGSVFADFIENAVVNAGVDVQSNSIMNSQVSADGKVLLTGKRGSLIGGYTHGLLGVEATSVGNESEIKTVVHAGYDIRAYEKYLMNHKKEQELQASLASAVDEMMQILNDRRSGKALVTRESDQRLLALNSKKDECFSKLNELKSDKEILSATVERGKGAMIKVKGPIRRGTVICLETVQMPLERSTSFMKYSVKNGVIEGQVIII